MTTEDDLQFWVRRLRREQRWALESIAATTTLPDTGQTVGSRWNGAYGEVSCSGGARTINLPPLADVLKGSEIVYRKTDSSSNALTVDAYGDETIEGELTKSTARQHQAIHLVRLDSEWGLKHHVGAGLVYVAASQPDELVTDGDFWLRQ